MANTKSRTVRFIQSLQEKVTEAHKSAMDEGYPEDIQTELSNLQTQFSRLGATIKSASPTNPEE